MKRMLMKGFKIWALALFASLFLTGAKERPTRLDVSVQPEGARVFVDGELKGTAPCSVFDLSVGRHLVHVEASSCLDADAFVMIGDGEFVQKNFELEAEKALILIKTEPPGAEVKYSGVSMGVTPFLVSTLPSGRTYAFELSLNGYQTRKIDIVAEGRTPIVREENLALDSGVVNCTSEPSGATVTVNGVEKGVTPIELTNIPKGLATITLKLAGYKEETRELRLVPGDRQTLAVKLKGSPARLTVVTAPEQARIFLDNDYQGKSPVTMASVNPGKHEIRVVLPGHAPVTRTVEVVNGGETTEEFKMESVMGRLEVVTAPAGAKVMIDGKAFGTTRSQGGDATRSQTLALENVTAGEHSVVVRLDGYQEFQRKIIIKPQATSKLFPKLIRLFEANTVVETIRGTYRGVLVENNPLTGVTLEIKKGVQQTFPHADIRKIYPIEKDQ